MRRPVRSKGRMRIIARGTVVRFLTRSRLILAFAAVLVLMTCLILYNANSAADLAYAPVYVAVNRTVKTINFWGNRTVTSTNFKSWSGPDDYVPVHLNKSMNLHCHQCAVVTSSSHVLGIREGKEIDSTECVIRMNNSPTLGYESDIGSRTTLRIVDQSGVYGVVNNPNKFLRDTDPNPMMIFWGPPSHYAKEAKGTLYTPVQNFSRRYNHVSCFIIKPDKMFRLYGLYGRESEQYRVNSNSWVSTGFITMIIAMEVCDDIKVYGMVPPNYCTSRQGKKTMPYHYYSPRGDDECVMYRQHQNGKTGSHRFMTEKHIFARWAKLYNITFVHPKW
ncbi:alpha-N-acetylgalactosaminide alpha-2,6-sialyltransferase 6-like isoform 1-T2 [Pholidichthys leucotaenia]